MLPVPLKLETFVHAAVFGAVGGDVVVDLWVVGEPDGWFSDSLWYVPPTAAQSFSDVCVPVGKPLLTPLGVTKSHGAVGWLVK